MNGSKKWYRSRAIWGSIIAAGALVAQAFGVSVAAADQAALVDVALQLATAFGVVLAAFGRIRANSRISSVFAPAVALPVAAVVLSACAARDAETPAQKLFAVQSEFNAVLQPVKSYVTQPECGPAVVVGCADTAVKSTIKRLVAEAGTAIGAARKALSSGAGGAGVADAAALVRRLVVYLVQKEVMKNESTKRIDDPATGRSAGDGNGGRAGITVRVRPDIGAGQTNGDRRPGSDAGRMGSG
jgi:hypothetical protein